MPGHACVVYAIQLHATSSFDAKLLTYNYSVLIVQEAYVIFWPAQGGAFALVSPLSEIWGTRPPVPPVYTPME